MPTRTHREEIEDHQVRYPILSAFDPLSRDSLTGLLSAAPASANPEYGVVAVEVGVVQVFQAMNVTGEALSSSRRWAAMVSSRMLCPIANPTNPSTGAATRSRCDSNAAGRPRVS